MDADLFHDPKEIPKMIDILNESSFVIGSRYKKGVCEMTGHRLDPTLLVTNLLKRF